MLLKAQLEARIAREFPGMSISSAYKQLGKDSGGYPLATMQRVCSGKSGPSIDTLADIAHALGCTLSDLFLPVQDSTGIKEAPPVEGSKATSDSRMLWRRASGGDETGPK